LPVRIKSGSWQAGKREVSYTSGLIAIGYGTRREANYLPDEEEVSPIARSDTDRTIAEIPEDY
jgi:hypothetical protein